MRDVRAMALPLLVAALAGCGRAAPVGESRASEAEEPAHVAAASEVKAGEYLTTVGGCNDCHTPGWIQTNGAVKPEDRLTGVPLGWSGPWGTSYAKNLRLSAQDYDADGWVAMIRARNALPPMPWMNLHRMNDRDLKAVHAYLRALGPRGERMPAPLPPGVKATTPVISLVPQ